MVIKIPGSLPGTQQPGSASQPGAGTAASGSGRAGARPGAATERVDLTDAAVALLNLERSGAGSPAVDEQRVEAIRRSLDDGTYTVDAQRTAANLLKIEGGLFGEE